MNTIKTYALIGTSIVSVALLYRNFYLAGVIEGMRKAHKKAVYSAIEHTQNVYIDRINKILENHNEPETLPDDQKAILDIMNSTL